MSEQQFWQLQEFAKNVGVHYTTMNYWSNLVERKRIHYITRAKGNNKKVYDELDLRVFRFIKEKREESWNLEAIMDILTTELQGELRPFPNEFTDNQAIITVEQVKNEVEHMMQGLLEQYQEDIQSQLQAHIETIRESLPKLPDPNEERSQRVNQMLTEQRIKHTLELEALEEWAKLPDTERLRKTGLFRKEEDSLKREMFLRTYVHKHYESRLRKEFGMEE